MQQFVQFQHELKVNYCQLVTVMAEPPVVQAAFRAGLASNRHFYPMKNEKIIQQINIHRRDRRRICRALTTIHLCITT